MAGAAKKVDLTADRLYSLSWGLIYCTVCAPKSWSCERVADEKTRMDPPGTSVNRWEVSEPRERSDNWNGINQMPCPDDPNRIHWLVNC